MLLERGIDGAVKRRVRMMTKADKTLHVLGVSVTRDKC